MIYSWYPQWCERWAEVRSPSSQLAVAVAGKHRNLVFIILFIICSGGGVDTVSGCGKVIYKRRSGKTNHDYGQSSILIALQGVWYYLRFADSRHVSAILSPASLLCLAIRACLSAHCGWWHVGHNTAINRARAAHCGDQESADPINPRIHSPPPSSTPHPAPGWPEYVARL